MPRLLFDARPMAEHGGVSRVAKRVLLRLRQSRPNTEIKTITTGWDRSDASIHLRLPNKLWSLLVTLGLTSLDRAAGESFDELILPNIGFVGTPRIPYTIVVHDLSFLIEPRWFPLRMRLWHHAVRAKKLIRNAAHVWCVSQTTANDVARLLNVPAERITILPKEIMRASTIHHTLHTTHYTPYTTHPTSNAPTKPYVLAFTGSRRKNAATAIAAVARLRQNPRFANLRLFLIGEHTARHHLHQPWLAAVPAISDEQLRDYYQNAAAFLYPSWYEGFGLPLHEAAAYNLPILASAHSALPETGPNQAIFIPPAKPHLWTAALRDALNAHSH